MKIRIKLRSEAPPYMDLVIAVILIFVWILLASLLRPPDPSDQEVNQQVSIMLKDIE